MFRNTTRSAGPSRSAVRNSAWSRRYFSDATRRPDRDSEIPHHITQREITASASSFETKTAVFC
jgi:hypothetical protein